MARITSAWSTTQVVEHDPPRAWLRAPLAPGLDRPVWVASFTDDVRPLEVGVFRPLGATFAFTIRGKRGAGGFVLTATTTSPEELDQLLALLDYDGTLQLNRPQQHGERGSRDYVSVAGDVRLVEPLDNHPGRYVEVPLVRVARP